MQLCANARLFLDMVAASGQPKLWELTPPEAREKVIELTRMVECEEAIGKIEDRTLPGPAGLLSYRVYTPLAASDGPSGGMVFFHGGAWVLGDLDTHDCLCRRQRRAFCRLRRCAAQRWRPAASRGAQSRRRQAPSGSRASGSEEPSRLSHSRGMPPHTSRGPGSAARPQCP